MSRAVPSRPATYAKAIGAGAGALSAALVAAAADHGVSLVEWVSAVCGALVTGAAVFRTPNDDPDQPAGRHQAG